MGNDRAVAGPIDPSESGYPANYRCSDCHNTGRRLWLDTAALHGNDTPLFCMECAEGKERRMHPPRWRSARRQGTGDTIGRYVPAVPLDPAKNDQGYHDPHNIPRGRRQWWTALPVNPRGDIDQPTLGDA